MQKFKDHKAQELAMILSKDINKKDIWFVHDSDLEDKQINVLSVKKFRQCMGLDWSIIAKKGWLLGDFAFYTAINCEIDYKYYYLIEDDVRFSGNALNIFLEETTKKSVDFLCPKYGERDQSSGWLMKFSYSHPNESANMGCFFPITRASKNVLTFLMRQRIGEFKNFIDNNEFSEIEANKFFSNDEAFMCNMIKNTMLYSIEIVAEKITKKYFSMNRFAKITNIKGDHIIHKYCPEDNYFPQNLKNFINNRFEGNLHCFLFSTMRGIKKLIRYIEIVELKNRYFPHKKGER